MLFDGKCVDLSSKLMIHCFYCYFKITIHQKKNTNITFKDKLYYFVRYDVYYKLQKHHGHFISYTKILEN